MGQLVEQASLIMTAQNGCGGCWPLTVQSFKSYRCRRCCTVLSTPREMSRMPGTLHWGDWC